MCFKKIIKEKATYAITNDPERPSADIEKITVLKLFGIPFFKWTTIYHRESKTTLIS